MPIYFISHPNDKFRLGDFLNESFAETQWTDFQAAVAFVKRSGTKHIISGISNFVAKGGKVVITAGIDVGGTTVEALQDLLNALNGKGKLFVFHNANNSTFHPKIYLFKNNVQARVVIGSANMTEGGLYTNYEANLKIDLDLRNDNDAEFLTQMEKTLLDWSTEQNGKCYQVTPEFIQQLVSQNYLPTEVIARAERKSAVRIILQSKIESIFSSHSVPPAPKIDLSDQEQMSSSEDEGEAIADLDDESTFEVEVHKPASPQSGKFSVFLMTLQKTDVGIGQTTRGTQRRSPEIFIPLICRDFDPEFWGWPDTFLLDKNWTGPKDQYGRGKMDRTDVMVRLGGNVFPVSIWYNPDKKDVRIRSEHLRSAGAIDDILYIERADGTAGYTYYVDIIPKGSVRYPEYISMCSKTVRNSLKKWNYL